MIPGTIRFAEILGRGSRSLALPGKLSLRRGRRGPHLGTAITRQGREDVGVKDQLQQVRRLVPASRFPAMVTAKVDTLWADEAFRESQELQMRHLLERTERADEIPDLARKYAEAQMMRRWLRWKPHLLTQQAVRGARSEERRVGKECVSTWS